MQFTPPWREVFKRNSTQDSLVETKMAECGAHFDEETLQKVYSKVICRKHEIQSLLTLFGTRASFSCPGIFVCGHTATGKSFVVRTLLKDLEVR